MLRDMLIAYGDAEAKSVRYEIEGYPPKVTKIIWPFPELPLNPKVPILAGEVIQSLRSALDYLIYDLAILDSGKPQDGTQFPAEGDPESFDRHNLFTPKRTRSRTCSECHFVVTTVIDKESLFERA